MLPLKPLLFGFMRIVTARIDSAIQHELTLHALCYWLAVLVTSAMPPCATREEDLVIYHMAGIPCDPSCAGTFDCNNRVYTHVGLG